MLCNRYKKPDKPTPNYDEWKYNSDNFSFCLRRIFQLE